MASELAYRLFTSCSIIVILVTIYKKEIKTINIEKSKKYSIDGKNGDVDLIIAKDDEVEFIEVKSFGQFEKFKNEQLEKYSNYILQEYKKQSKTITILFYLIDSNLLEKYIDDFTIIKEKLKESKIVFKVKYIEVQPENFQNFVREFENKQIQEFDVTREAELNNIRPSIEEIANKLNSLRKYQLTRTVK